MAAAGAGGGARAQASGAVNNGSGRPLLNCSHGQLLAALDAIGQVRSKGVRFIDHAPLFTGEWLDAVTWATGKAA